MHAVYSVSSDPRKTKRKPRDTRRIIDGFTAKGSYHLVSHLSDSKQLLTGQQLSSKGMRMRRDNEELRTLDDDIGTNMKMIRLIYESRDNTIDVRLQEREENSYVTSKSESSLVNPLVIGIGVFCGVLLVALVVVWILYKRKVRQEQPPVQVTAQAVSSPNVQGTVV